MWPRVVEIMLGVWLIISPFVLRYENEHLWMWFNDFSAGAFAMTFSLLSYRSSTRRSHLFLLILSGWLLCYGMFIVEQFDSAAAQNVVVIGLLLLMIAIIPSESSKPPVEWREFYQQHSEGSQTKSSF